MILYRYVAREFMRPFFYSLITIMSLFMMQLAIRLLPRVLYKGVPLSVVGELFAVNIAHITVLSVPMSILIAMLMVFGKLSSDNEITAIKAGGRSIASLLPPVAAVSSLIAVIMMFFNTIVLPEANHHASALMSDIMRKKPAALIQPGILIRDFPGYAILVDSVESSTGRLFGVKIFSEQQGNTPSITVAESGTVFLTADENYLELKLFGGEVHSNGARGAKDHFRVDFDTQLVYIQNIDSKLTRSENSSRGDREKTNDQLIQEAEALKVYRTELLGAHAQGIEKLAAMVDTLSKPVGAKRAAEDSLRNLQWEKNRQEALARNGMYAGKRHGIFKAVGDAASTVKKDTAAVPDSSSYLKLLAEIENAGGEMAYRSARSEFNRAEILTGRIKKQDEMINSCMVEVHKKYALAAAVIVFALLGVPLGVISRSGSVPISVSYSLIFFIIYYAFLVAGEKASEVHGIPAWISMWSGNVILGVFALFMIGRTARETSFVNWNWIRTAGSAINRSLLRMTGRDVQAGVPVKPFILFRIVLFPFKLIGMIFGIPGWIMRFIMPKIPGYILGRFISFFLTVTVGLMVLTVVIDYVSTINVLEGAEPKELVRYYLYFMAWFLSIILPMSLLLATMMTIGSFARTNELTAIKASGISMVKMTIPLLFVGVFFSVFSFYFAERVLPPANKERDLLKETFAARRNNQPIPEAKKSYKYEFYYFSSPETAYRFTHFQTSPPRGDRIVRYRFGKGALLETVEMDRMEYENGKWIMFEGVKRDFSLNGGYRGKRFERQPDSYIKDTPDEMVQTVGVPEELSHGELKQIMEKGRQRGEDVSKYEADLKFKFALPVMNFIMILIGVAVTARSDKRGGAVYFGVGLITVLLFWAVSQFLLVFGRSGQLSPMFAAWGGTVLFLIIGLFFYRRASR